MYNKKEPIKYMIMLVLERPQGDAFLSSWKDSQHQFSQAETTVMKKGKVICLETPLEKTKFFAVTGDGKLKSVCFPYEGKSPERVFSESFERFFKEITA